MRGWGLTEELIEAIMAPEYADLRMTESAQVWTIDTMGWRWRALVGIQDASRERLRRKHGVRDAGGGYHIKRGGAERGVEEGPTEGEKPSEGRSRTKGLGYTLLWRGQDLKYLERVIDADGKYHLWKMSSTLPSDFRGIGGSSVLHFTPQRRVAEKYAQYAQRRSGCSGVGLVWMRVPNELIEKNEPVVQQYGDEWKKIVFASRRGERLSQELKALQRKSLFIGPICRNEDMAISQLDSWRGISVEKNVMHINKPIWDFERKEWASETRPATRYVFNGDDLVQELEEAATLRIIGVEDMGPVFAGDNGEGSLD